MTDNEKLIEEAAAKRYPHRNVFLEGMAYMTEERSRLPLREAFVEGAKWQAEKAHTPTDDEREALRIAELDARQAAYRKEREDWFVDHEAEPEIARNAFFRGWDAAVGGGFRRLEVPEPSVEDQAAYLRGDEAHFSKLKTPEPQGEPSDPNEHTPACDAWADMNGSGCTCHVEQGEPSDAQVAEIEQRVYDQNRGQVAGMAKALVRAGWDAAVGGQR